MFFMARWRSGNAGVCKTSMQGFNSLPRLKRQEYGAKYPVGRQGEYRFPAEQDQALPDNSGTRLNFDIMYTAQ